MARTTRNRNQLTRDYARDEPRRGQTVERLNAKLSTDATWRLSPPSWFRRGLNRKQRSKLNSCVRNVRIVDIETDIELPATKRSAFYLWF